MDPMTHLALGTAAFLGTHYISSTPLRAALVKALGENGYLGLYSLVSFATLGWMIWAYKHAPLAALWPGLRLAPLALMPLALVLKEMSLPTGTYEGSPVGAAAVAGSPA